MQLMDSNIYQITVERLYDRDLLFARGVHVKIFWHLIAPSFTPDFLGEVGLILVLAWLLSVAVIRLHFGDCKLLAGVRVHEHWLTQAEAIRVGVGILALLIYLETDSGSRSRVFGVTMFR